jgi:hypothetical protein
MQIVIPYDYVQVCITDRILWHERCTWIGKNCDEPQDATNWSMWQIGQDDIYFLLRSKDATLYYLTWS